MGDVSHGSRMYTMSLNLLCARREKKIALEKNKEFNKTSKESCPFLVE
jgi:hypothetical protein